MTEPDAHEPFWKDKEMKPKKCPTCSQMLVPIDMVAWTESMRAIFMDMCANGQRRIELSWDELED
jgi:hypothetical protein